MNNEKYLSEERYQQNNKKVKNIGKVLLIIGILILIAGIVVLFLGFTGVGNTITNTGAGNVNNHQVAKDAFGGIGLFALGGFMTVTGFALTSAGGIAMFIAHRREILAYTTQQVMPVAQEGIEKITPTVADAAGSIAKGISKGIQEGKKEAKE